MITLRSKALTASMVAVALIVTLASAPPAAAKVRQPFRTLYKSQLLVLTERNTALLVVEKDANGGFTDRIADCGAQAPDPVGMTVLADAVRASADAWWASGTGAAKNVKGMVSADWFTNPADVGTVKRAANTFVQYANRGKEALYGVASAYEAMGAGDCGTATKVFDAALGDQGDAADLYKTAMTTFRRVL